jgi:hypothetical protein
MQQTTSTVRDRAHMIALALGDGWTIDSPANPEDDSLRANWIANHATLTHRGGTEINISVGSWKDSDKLSVSFSWPYDSTGQMHIPSESERPSSIKVSAAKPDATIAREITRRLLEPGREAFQAQLQRAQQASNFCVASERLAKRIAAAVGGEARGRDWYTHQSGKPQSQWIVDGHGDFPSVEVTGDHIAFDVRTEDEDLAIFVLRKLKAARG